MDESIANESNPTSSFVHRLSKPASYGEPGELDHVVTGHGKTPALVLEVDPDASGEASRGGCRQNAGLFVEADRRRVRAERSRHFTDAHAHTLNPRAA